MALPRLKRLVYPGDCNNVSSACVYCCYTHPKSSTFISPSRKHLSPVFRLNYLFPSLCKRLSKGSGLGSTFIIPSIVAFSILRDETNCFSPCCRQCWYRYRVIPIYLHKALLRYGVWMSFSFRDFIVPTLSKCRYILRTLSPKLLWYFHPSSSKLRLYTLQDLLTAFQLPFIFFSTFAIISPVGRLSKWFSVLTIPVSFSAQHNYHKQVFFFYHNLKSPVWNLIVD